MMKAAFAKGYQLETILRTDLRGRALAAPDREWCFYAGWFSKRLPRVVGVRELAAAAISVPNDPLPRKAALATQGAFFVNLILDTIYQSQTPYGLELSESQVGSAVEGLFHTSSDMRLLLASAENRPELILKRTDERSISGSLIPERWLASRARRRLSNEVDARPAHPAPERKADTYPPEMDAEPIVMTVTRGGRI